MIPVKLTRAARLVPALLLAVTGLFVPAAHAQSVPTGSVYGTYPDSVPAASAGIPGLQVYASTGYSASDFNVCIYTGYGSTTPIVPDSTSTGSGSVSFTIDVPASTIQQVPPSAFAVPTYGGPPSFSAEAYLVLSGATTCTGTPPPDNGEVALTILYPVLNSVSTGSIPAQNPNLSSRIPANLNVDGSNFLGSTIGSPAAAVTSTINLSGTTYSGNAATLYASSTSLRGTVPTNIPADTSVLEVSVCNTAAGNSYCSNGQTIGFYALAADPGTLTANPAAPTAGQPVTFTAQFGPTPFSAAAGAPGGLVTFAEGSNIFGTAKLLLDPTAQFTQLASDGNSSTFTVNSASTIQSYVADFNQDGVPDSMFVDQTNVVFHIILGLPPYAVDNPVTLNQAVDCTSILSTAVADFNGDGIPDIAFACTSNNGNVVYTMLGAGDGSTFATPIQVQVPDVPSPMLVAGDFNKDGITDLALQSTFEASTSVIVLTGLGTGNFNVGPTQGPYNLGDINQFLGSDLNGDGAADLLFVGPSGINALQNNGSGVFGAPINVFVGVGSETVFLAPFGPGQLPSLIIFDYTDALQESIQNTSTAGTVSFAGFANGGYAGEFPGLTSAAVGDFNGDGLVDYAVSYNSGVAVSTGDGTGLFSATTYTSLTDPNATNTTLVGAVDENGDGYADLLALNIQAEQEGGKRPRAAAGTKAAAGTTAQKMPQADTTGQGKPKAAESTVPLVYSEIGYVTAGTASATLGATPSFQAGAHTITATTPGTYTLAGGSATDTFTIVPTTVTPTIKFTAAPASPITYGTSTVLTAEIDGTPTPTGSISFSDGTTPLGSAPLTPSGTGITIATLTVGPLGAATHNFTASYAGDQNYNPATATVTDYVVQQATPATIWTPNPSSIVYGTPLSAAQLDATSPVAGGFAYTPGLTTVLKAGQQTLSAVFTPTDTTDYKSVTINTNITVTQATPTVTWTPKPDTIPYGTPLSGAQLDAKASVAGTFAYTPGLNTVLPAGTQTLSVVFTPTDTTDYKSVTATTTITVTQANYTVSWTPNPATIVYGTPLSAGQLDATASIPGTFAYTPALNAVLTAGQQTLTAVFTPTDTKDYKSTTTTAIITVSQATPTVTWTPNPASIPYGTALSAAQLDAQSPVAGTFAYTPGLGTVLPAGTQTLSAVFTPTDATDYKSVTTTTTITVTQANYTITWTPNPATIVYGTPLSASQLDATASIAGTFAYTPALNAVLTAGQQTLTAIFTPTDTKDYKSTTTTATITVTQAKPTVTWTPNPASIVYGTALSAAQLDATSPTAGTFAYTPALNTVLAAGTQTLSAVFTPTDTTDYKSVTTTTTITVTAATPTITWTPNPASIVYGTALSASQLDAKSSVAGTFAYTPALGTVLSVGSQTLTAVFTPTDTTDYKSVTATTTITVTQASATITWTPNPASIIYGTPLSGSQLDAQSTIPGTFVYTPALNTVLTAGQQTLSAVFTPNDTKDYKSFTVTTTITVTQATPTVTWTPNPANITYGTALSVAQLDAKSPVAGTFVYTPAAGTVLSVGTQTLSAIFTPTDSTDYKPVTTTTTITVTPASTTITWAPNPATITYGTPLSAGQLDAQSSVPGTFAYTPALKAVLSAGQQTLTAVFTPTDQKNYKSVTVTAFITVTQATPTVTWTPNPASIAYGTPLSGAQLDATSTTAGTFAYTPALNTVLTAGTQTLTAVFTPTDTTNYKAVTTTTIITVTQSGATITWKPNPATITYGTALSGAQLDAQSTVPGTFVYTPALNTVLAAGTQTLSAVFTPNDTKDYKSATVTTTITVTSAGGTITWTPNPASIVYGTALSTAQLDAQSSIPGTFAYTPALGTVLTAGTQTLTTVFTPTDTKDYKTLTASTTITVTQATPSITWTPSPATISYGTPLSAAQLDAKSPVAGAFAYTPTLNTVLTAGTQILTAVFTPTDAKDYTSATATTTITVTPAGTTISWVPNPATIVYGTPLSSAQLDATSTIAGTFTYTPALNTVLSAGQQTLSALFTPSDTKNYKPITTTATITVSKATAALAWPTPADIVAGTPLSGTQLDATATGVTGAKLPGTFVYTPPATTILSAGQHQLSVAFTPTDATDYSSVTAAVPINVIGVGLTSITPATALLGAANTTITLTGTGFVSNSVALVNGTPVATSYVNLTTLTAVIPASDFLTAQSLQISVYDPTQKQTTNTLPLVVGAPPPAVVLSGPATTTPGDEPQLTFQLTNPYPVDLSGTLVLTFAPENGNPDDPMVRFASTGTNSTDPTGRTMDFTIPANSTATPTVMIQSGSVEGTITVTLTLTAGGTNVTPASILPVVITDPATVPGITSVTMSATGKVLTVTVVGYSNTRELAQALFDFTPASGKSLKTTNLLIDDTSIFTTWYASPTSDQYGSTFTYTQVFNLDEDATVVGGVSVTLINTVGNSAPGSTSTTGTTP